MRYCPLVKDIEGYEAIILADGTFPQYALGRAFLRWHPRIVCCDGAADRLICFGRVPLAIVGDGDSVGQEIREQYSSLFHCEKEQDTNDLSKAFRYCLKCGWHRILILGATGKREDHTLGNIGLLSDFQDRAEVEMLTDYGLFTPLEGEAELESFPGQQVSIFNRKARMLRGEGLVYPLSAFTDWWQGTLNEAMGKSFMIYADGKVLVYRAHLLSSF